jgi:hypothetical protein
MTAFGFLSDEDNYLRALVTTRLSLSRTAEDATPNCTATETNPSLP